MFSLGQRNLLRDKPAVRLAQNADQRQQTTRARASNLTLPHGPVQLPMFMPVATQASLKGITPEQLEETGCTLCLNNTYHLGLKPGQEVLDAIGGAHKFQGWNHNILTDSGG
jgi:queuine tRNA-ribosyltransferase